MYAGYDSTEGEHKYGAEALRCEALDARAGRTPQRATDDKECQGGPRRHEVRRGRNTACKYRQERECSEYNDGWRRFAERTDIHVGHSCTVASLRSISY